MKLIVYPLLLLMMLPIVFAGHLPILFCIVKADGEDPIEAQDGDPMFFNTGTNEWEGDCTVGLAASACIYSGQNYSGIVNSTLDGVGDVIRPIGCCNESGVPPTFDSFLFNTSSWESILFPPPIDGSSSGALQFGCCTATNECSYNNLCYQDQACRYTPSSNGYWYSCDAGEWRFSDSDGDQADDVCDQFDSGDPSDPCSIFVEGDNCGGPGCPNCLVGVIYNAAGGLGGALVQNIGNPPENDISIANGSYSILPISAGNQDIIVTATAHTPTRVNDLDILPGFNYMDFYLGIGPADCQNDCTRLSDSEICAVECEFTNNCVYFDSSTAEICDNKPLGFVLQYNETHDIICCDGTPFVREIVPASVEVDSNNVITVTRTVWLNGKLVKMVVTVFE